jgi:hypothetical protein
MPKGRDPLRTAHNMMYPFAGQEGDGCDAPLLVFNEEAPGSVVYNGM